MSSAGNAHHFNAHSAPEEGDSEILAAAGSVCQFRVRSIHVCRDIQGSALTGRFSPNRLVQNKKKLHKARQRSSFTSVQMWSLEMHVHVKATAARLSGLTVGKSGSI